MFLPNYSCRILRKLISICKAPYRLLVQVSNSCHKIEEIHTLLLLQQQYPEIARQVLPVDKHLKEALFSDGALPPLPALNVLKRLRRSGIDSQIEMLAKSISLPYSQTTALFQEILHNSRDNEVLVLQKYIRYLYRHGLDDTLLLQNITRFLTICPKRSVPRDILCIAVTCFLEANDHPQALDALQRYAKLFSTKGLERFPLVAHFSHSYGITNKFIRNAAYLVDAVEKSRKNGVLREYLDGKRIAVVGNGPFEIGKGKGREIDSHDVVIRFNHSVVNSQSSADYGTQTTLWVRNAATAPQFRHFPTARYLFLNEGLERYILPTQYVNALARDAAAMGRVLAAPSRHEYQAVCKPFDYTRFTSGFFCIAYLLYLGVPLRSESLYGFAFKEEGLTSYTDIGPYFSESQQVAKNAYAVHSLSREREAFHTLFPDG